MVIASACGKIILFGEHAVVYGRPALAVPLRELRAWARVESRAEPGVIIHARELKQTFALAEARADDGESEGFALAAITRATLAKLDASADAALDLWLESDIPLASGLGSGAAVSTAIVRALAMYFDKSLSVEEISWLVYETERLYHGTPSGIDNAVIALEQPIRFTRAEGATPIHITRPFTLVIANTGIASPTKITVGDVRRAWERDPARYEKIFDEIAQVVEEAERALSRGANDALGELMNRNQELLRALDVSSREIEMLLAAGLNAGSRGGKLSGAGRGGNVIFYVEQENAEHVREVLFQAGAASVIVTEVK